MIRAGSKGYLYQLHSESGHSSDEQALPVCMRQVCKLARVDGLGVSLSVCFGTVLRLPILRCAKPDSEPSLAHLWTWVCTSGACFYAQAHWEGGMNIPFY